MNGQSLKIGKGCVGRVGAIAECTFLESVRDRTLSVPVLLAGLMIGGALFTRTLSLGQQVKLLQDFGLAGICFSRMCLSSWRSRPRWHAGWTAEPCFPF